MALTKLDYLRIAERVEAMYMNCSTQLILNIVRHLASGKGLSTAEWQIKKLSEMQSLTRESMEIIAANTGKRREAVEQAFREVFGIGLADTEKVLQAAVKAGKLIPVPSVEESEAMRQLLQAYIGQADDALNLVNTVMLDSTLSRYRYYVNQIDMESQKEAARILQKLGATDEKGLGTNLAYTQNVLNTQSTGVVTGAVARQKAVRDAIKDLASKGITGFVDAGGHHWTPEAYVNMDIRTTAHNVAIEAQKQRSAEYGVSTFQISTHAGARPLCAPYQGWICSWDNGGGTVTDLYGKEYQVHGINETSYGEAAGIFGINCGHFPETFVDGYSIPRYEELTPEQEKQNEIEYAQSQTQRELEREIRQAKTEAAAYSAAGDKEAFQKAAAKVKEKQTDYKQFCEQTGRTPRPDRTQVSTYSRSEASKVSWSNRKNPTEPKPPMDFTPKPKKEKAQMPKPLKPDENGAMRGIPKLTPTTPAELANGVNPLYERSTLYRENCANCVIAEELRIRGYDVEADLKDYSTKISYFWHNGGVGMGGWQDSFIGGVKSTDIGATRKPQQIGRIQDIMNSWGNDSRAVVFVQWDGKTIGHYFTAVNENGTVRFINPQHPTEDASEFFTMCRPSQTVLFRVDNKELADFVRKVVTWKGKTQ